MKCPKCQGEMEPVIYAKVEVDRCRRCQGIWFDGSELDDLLEARGSESIDTGDPATGKRMNLQDRIKCPRGHGPLLRMVDPEQTHIWYERCTVCSGTYLDAGEFKDLKHDTLWDFFRDLFTRERR